jgi:hypothetical protein
MYMAQPGPKPKVSTDFAKQMVNPNTNPIRYKGYRDQAKYSGIDAHPETIQKSLKKNTKNARRYKQPYRKSEMSDKNRRERVKYGEDHKQKPLPEFWTRVMFTDEAHLDPTSFLQGYILREEGTRYDPENIQIGNTALLPSLKTRKAYLAYTTLLTHQILTQ